METLVADALIRGLEHAMKTAGAMRNPHILDSILNSMADEKVLFEKTASDLMRFDAESGKRWDALEIDQLKASDDFVEDAMKEIAV